MDENTSSLMGAVSESFRRLIAREGVSGGLNTRLFTRAVVNN